MDKDRLVGSAKDFAGKVEGTVGDIASDAKTQASGSVREATGAKPLRPGRGCSSGGFGCCCQLR